MFGSNLCVFERRRVGERMLSACVVLSVKHGGGDVMVWGGFDGDTVCDLFRIQCKLNQRGQHSAATRHPIWFALSQTIISFSTGQ